MVPAAVARKRDYEFDRCFETVVLLADSAPGGCRFESVVNTATRQVDCSGRNWQVAAVALADTVVIERKLLPAASQGRFAVGWQVEVEVAVAVEVPEPQRREPVWAARMPAAAVRPEHVLVQALRRKELSVQVLESQGGAQFSDAGEPGYLPS